MSPTLIVALIALFGSILSTVVTVVGTPALAARNQARQVLATYREPLLAASYELQARLYNILRIGFVDRYILDESAGKRQPAIDSTLYVLAQFFGWREAIRQEIQHLGFSRTRRTREIALLLQDIGETFLSDHYGRQFMVWRTEQRAIGERMLDASSGKLACLGYASFLDKRPSMEQWLAPLAQDLLALDEGGSRRLTDLQHLLLDLVRKLDDHQTRYPFAMERA